jgi:hypothetical protein
MLSGRVVLTIRQDLILPPRRPLPWQLVVPAEFLEECALHCPTVRLHRSSSRSVGPRDPPRTEAVFCVNRHQDVRNDLGHHCIPTDRIRCAASQNLVYAHPPVPF